MYQRCFAAFDKTHYFGHVEFTPDISNHFPKKAIYKLGSLYNEPTLDCRLGANCGFLNCMEAGVYGGVGVFIEEAMVGAENIDEMFLMLAYGINVYFHPLSLLIPPKSFWFDLYFTGKAGGKTFKGGYGWGSGFRAEWFRCRRLAI